MRRGRLRSKRSLGVDLPSCSRVIEKLLSMYSPRRTLNRDPRSRRGRTRGESTIGSTTGDSRVRGAIAVVLSIVLAGRGADGLERRVRLRVRRLITASRHASGRSKRSLAAGLSAWRARIDSSLSVCSAPHRTSSSTLSAVDAANSIPTHREQGARRGRPCRVPTHLGIPQRNPRKCPTPFL